MTDMDTHNPKSTAKVAGHPLHPMIIPFPIAFFVSALVTDILYLNTGRAGFAEASMWMLGAGLGTALLAAVLGLIDFMGERRIRSLQQAWLHMLGNVVVVAIEAVNLYARWNGDMTDAVAPMGVTLSAASVLLLLFNGWMGWEMVYRGHVGVSDDHTHGRMAHR